MSSTRQSPRSEIADESLNHSVGTDEAQENTSTLSRNSSPPSPQNLLEKSPKPTLQRRPLKKGTPSSSPRNENHRQQLRKQATPTAYHLKSSRVLEEGS